MTIRQKTDPLDELFRSQQEEINKYKWIESEKAGRDIGWERAAEEWMRNCFPKWKHHRWQELIREADRKAQSRN